MGTVVAKAWEGIARSGRDGEVIVVDNGSTDGSAEIASSHRISETFRSLAKTLTGRGDFKQPHTGIFAPFTKLLARRTGR